MFFSQHEIDTLLDLIAKITKVQEELILINKAQLEEMKKINLNKKFSKT